MSKRAGAWRKHDGPYFKQLCFSSDDRRNGGIVLPDLKGVLASLHQPEP